MSRRTFIAGNWKMNTDRAGAIKLALDVHAGLDASRIDAAVCPPFVYIDAVSHALRERSSKLMVGAQDVYHEPVGAFTGEVSPAMLKDVGVAHVIIGHSERRHVLHESDELIRRKVRATLDNGLHAILCVGELLEQRERGETNAVNELQTRSALAGLSADHMARLTIAYEPVWAIGTGKTAKPEDAQHAHAHIRAVVASLHGADIAARVRIQYGGSMKPDNAKELLAQPDVDGGLIGGAALKPADFLAICNAAGQ